MLHSLGPSVDVEQLLTMSLLSELRCIPLDVRRIHSTFHVVVAAVCLLVVSRWPFRTPAISSNALRPD